MTRISDTDLRAEVAQLEADGQYERGFRISGGPRAGEPIVVNDGRVFAAAGLRWGRGINFWGKSWSPRAKMKKNGGDERGREREMNRFDAFGSDAPPKSRSTPTFEGGFPELPSRIYVLGDHTIGATTYPSTAISIVAELESS